MIYRAHRKYSKSILYHQPKNPKRMPYDRITRVELEGKAVRLRRYEREMGISNAPLLKEV